MLMALPAGPLSDDGGWTRCAAGHGRLNPEPASAAKPALPVQGVRGKFCAPTCSITKGAISRP